MRVIDGIKYYNSREVAELVGRERQTVNAWDNHSEELAARGEERLIPAPIRLGGGNWRFWSESQVAEIKEFADNIKRGDMAEYNRTRWGKR